MWQIIALGAVSGTFSEQAPCCNGYFRLQLLIIAFSVVFACKGFNTFFPCGDSAVAHVFYIDIEQNYHHQAENCGTCKSQQGQILEIDAAYKQQHAAGGEYQQGCTEVFWRN